MADKILLHTANGGLNVATVGGNVNIAMDAANLAAVASLAASDTLACFTTGPKKITVANLGVSIFANPIISNVTFGDTTTGNIFSFGQSGTSVLNREIRIYSGAAGKYLSVFCNADTGCGIVGTNGGTMSITSGFVFNLSTAANCALNLIAGGLITFQDKDASNTNRAIVDSANGDFQIQGSFGIYATPGTLADGDWQFVKSGNDLLIQKRVTGAWVTKQTIAG